jgi:hypothetical protein
VNRAWALADQPAKLVEPDVGRIAILQRATHSVSAEGHCKEQRFEAGAVIRIEGAVDENVSVS